MSDQLEIKFKARKICPTCGSKTVEYKHSLNQALVKGLSRLAECGGTAKLHALNISRVEWVNFQKLRYWDLVVKANGEDKQKGGVWRITEKGYIFLRGQVRIQKGMITYRGTPIRPFGDYVFVHEVLDGYKFKEDYAREALPYEQNDGPNIIY